MYRGFAIAAATIGACTLITYAVGVGAQETQPCPNGTVYITADTRAQATAAGIPTSAQCWNPNDANVGQSTGQAKQDLQGMWCGNSNAQCSYQGSTYTSTIDGLDPKFAVCADKFMQALRQQSPGACINSAYRSTAQQQCACARTCPDGNPNGCSGLCAPPGKSYHQRGLAIDVGKVTIPLQQFWNLALQFGVGNPTGLHSSDPRHIQSMNGGTNCASLGYQPTDTDVFTPGPTSNNPYFNYSPNPLPSMMPSTFNTPSQPGASGPANPTITGQSCAPQFLCMNNTIYFQSSSCTQQVYQTCSNGCSGTVCLPNPAASTTSPILGTTYPIIVQPATSALTALQQFVSPVATATAIAKSAPLALTPGIYDVIKAGTSTAQVGPMYQAGPIASNQGIPTDQTFGSSFAPAQSGYTNIPSASIVSILQNLQAILTNFLNYMLTNKK